MIADDDALVEDVWLKKLKLICFQERLYNIIYIIALFVYKNQTSSAILFNSIPNNSFIRSIIHLPEIGHMSAWIMLRSMKTIFQIWKQKIGNWKLESGLFSGSETKTFVNIIIDCFIFYRLFTYSVFSFLSFFIV